MPHSSHTQQTKTHKAAAGYSPRLCNDDLAPTRDQNWSWYNIFSFWMSDVHSMGGYVVAASFFTAWAGQLAGSALPAGGHLYCPAVRQPGGEAEPDGRGALRGDLSSGVWRFRRQYPGGDPRADRLCLVRHSDLSGGECPDAGPAQVLALPCLADQQQLSRAVAPRLAVLRHYVAAAGDGVLAWHERHQTLYRYRRSGGLCGDAGAGRLDCIQDWSGWYLLYPRQQILERRASRPGR